MANFPFLNHSTTATSKPANNTIATLTTLTPPLPHLSHELHHLIAEAAFLSLPPTSLICTIAPTIPDPDNEDFILTAHPSRTLRTAQRLSLTCQNFHTLYTQLILPHIQYEYQLDSPEDLLKIRSWGQGYKDGECRTRGPAFELHGHIPHDEVIMYVPCAHGPRSPDERVLRGNFRHLMNGMLHAMATHLGECGEQRATLRMGVTMAKTCEKFVAGGRECAFRRWYKRRGEMGEEAAREGLWLI
jgi:hypothetical protein